MRGDPGQVSFQFPRPGPVLKAVLIALVAFGVLGALLVNWGPSWGRAAFLALVFEPDRVAHLELWRFLTSGLLSSPQMSAGPLIFTLIGLYFLSPDLERRWGSRRFAGFLAASVVLGNLMAFAVGRLAFLSNPIFHPEHMFGATAAIAAIAIAWCRENAENEVRLMFFLPVKGKHLFWITVVYFVAEVIWGAQPTEGVIAPFGGILAGMTLGGAAGSPSMVRRTYLKLKLALLRRRTGHMYRAALPAARKARGVGGPSLRVLPGGLEEELRKREPPNDKRYLN
jgi:membrane associated rhomboid family serine protease